MNEFVSPETVNVAKRVNATLFPLERAKTLQADLKNVFSRYLCATHSGRRFEAEAMVVTGQSGSGKTKEIADLVYRFNSSEPQLPNGVRRQGFWNQWQLKLRESSAHLVGLNSP